MSKEFQVFVSSTYEDLRDERAEIIRAVLEMGHIPVGMEMFSAADDEQWRVIARTIDTVDYYVVIVAHRYGSVTEEGIGFTEKEYDYAAKSGVPTLGFIIDDAQSWPATKMEADEKKRKRLLAFKEKIKKKLVQFWLTRDDLRAKFSVSLIKTISSSPRVGWARANEIAGPEVTKELIRLSSENAELRKEIEKARAIAREAADGVRGALQILVRNSVKFLVRMTADWQEAKSFELTLAEIFQFVAPNLLNENSALGVAQDLALKLVGNKYHNLWPVGRNQTSELLADLAALDLVEPSKIRHQLTDKNSYWSLTKLGKSLLKDFRRVNLEEGLAKLPENQTSETKSASE